MQKFRCIDLKKKKFFLKFFFFFGFLKCTSILEHFLKKMNLIAFVFPKLRTPKDVVREMSKKSCFIGPIDRQHGQRAKTLFQSQREHVYHIH